MDDLEKEVFQAMRLGTEQLLLLNLLNSFFCFENILEDLLCSGGRERVLGVAEICLLHGRWWCLLVSGGL